MIIVTGANGFIGSAMVWELNQSGIDDIICTDTVRPEDRPELLKGLKFRQFVHTDEVLPLLRESSLLKDCQAIFHMGACSSTLEKNVDYLRVNNTEYTQHLFELCTLHNVPYIYASSGAVYGGGENGFDDRTPPDTFSPLNPYGASKLNFDKWVVQQATTPDSWYGLRFFNVYGPNEYHKGPMSSVAYKAFKQINETGRLKLFRSHHPDYKDGEQKRDFVYVKDITRWMLELLNKPDTANGIYNMGYGEARTWLDMAKGIFACMDRTLDIDWIDIPEDLRKQYQYFTEAKMDKLKDQDLSLPHWPLEKGIEDYIKKYLLTAHPHFS